MIFHVQGITVVFEAVKVLLHHAPWRSISLHAVSFVIGYAYDDRWCMSLR
ncbi:MAG: hypothetical protein R3E03_09220 [Novosphingobium sp.]